MYRFLVTISIIIPLAISSPLEYEPRSFIDVVKGLQNKTPTNGDCVARCPWFQIYKFLPHDDCNKYCVCLSRFQFTVECQKGTYFSARHDTCVDPTESECGKVEGCLGQCPHVSLNTYVSLPHEDCNKFCRCRKGRPIPENCAPNYQFDTDRQRCVSQEQAQCDRLNGFTTTTTTTTSTTESPTISDSTPEADPSTTPSPSSTASPSTTSSPTTTASPSTTSTSSTTASPSSTPSLSSTASPSTSSTSSPTTNPPATSAPVPTTSSAPTTENVKTSSVAPTTQNQALPNSLLELTTSRTVRSPLDRSVLNCTGHCPQSDDPESVVLLAHKDCTKYCRCKGGHPVMKNCPPQYHFSLDQEMCLPSNYTTCHHLTHH